ncbi:MAG: hypothetical protein QXM75_01640 [Candidatus Diapherotrites archaeon]
MILLYLFVVFLYVFAFIVTLAICRKLYGGGFSMALPYLISMVGIFAVANFLKFFGAGENISYSIENAPVFWFSIQTLYIIGGIMFVAMLYQFYHTRYVTKGWEEFR